MPVAVVGAWGIKLVPNVRQTSEQSFPSHALATDTDFECNAHACCMWCVVAVGVGGVGVSGCRGVGVSGCRGVGVSGCRGVEVSGCRGGRVGVWGCRGVVWK